MSQNGITEPWIILHSSTFYSIKEFAAVIDFAEGREFHLLTHLGARTVKAPDALRQINILTRDCAALAKADVAVKKDERASNRGAPPYGPHAGSDARPSSYHERSRERRQWEWWRGNWYYRDGPYERWQRWW